MKNQKFQIWVRHEGGTGYRARPESYDSEEQAMKRASALVKELEAKRIVIYTQVSPLWDEASRQAWLTGGAK